MLAEVLQRLIVEAREAVAEKRRLAIAQNCDDQIGRRDLAMEDRIGPHRRRQRNRNQFRAVGSGQRQLPHRCEQGRARWRSDGSAGHVPGARPR